LYDWANSNFEPTHRDIDQLSKDLSAFAQTGALAGDAARVYGANLAGLAADMSKIANPPALHLTAPSGGTVGVMGARAQAKDLAEANKQYKQSVADAKSFDETLAKLVTSGNATQAKVAFDRVTDSLAVAGQDDAGDQRPVRAVHEGGRRRGHGQRIGSAGFRERRRERPQHGRRHAGRRRPRAVADRRVQAAQRGRDGVRARRTSPSNRRSPT
jgi:hypothetical protein